MAAKTAADVVALLVEKWDRQWHLKINYEDMRQFTQDIGVEYNHSRRVWIDAEGNEAPYIDVPQEKRK